MKLLVDTHAALWLLAGDARLSARARSLLADPSNDILLSAAVVWEIAIKRATGKLVTDDSVVALLGSRMIALPVTAEHAEAAGALHPHHRDPFDRMLVAQAQIEDAAILSADPALRAYDVRVEW